MIILEMHSSNINYKYCWIKLNSSYNFQKSNFTIVIIKNKALLIHLKYIHCVLMITHVGFSSGYAIVWMRLQIQEKLRPFLLAKCDKDSESRKNFQAF